MSRRFEIANRIKTMRISRGLSQTELARLMQCGQSTIAMYETGKRSPDFETIDSFADVFNVAPHDLRHSYAVAALRSGIDVKTVQHNLGHKSATMTLDTYAAYTSDAGKTGAKNCLIIFRVLKIRVKLGSNGYKKRAKTPEK